MSTAREEFEYGPSRNEHYIASRPNSQRNERDTVKILILQPGRKFYLRTSETATANQKADAEGLGLVIASQRDRGIADSAVVRSFDSASEARAAAETLKPKVKVITARMLRAMAEDAVEAGA